MNNTNGNIYVGSTCQTTLAQRLSEHVSKYKRYMNGKQHYVTSFEIIKNGDYDMVLLEACSCETKDELHARERHYIESLNCVNKRIMGSKDRKEYKHQYYEAHKEKFKEIQKEYNENNKDHIKDIQKAYRLANGEKIKERKRRYYQAKKEAMKLNNELN